MISLIPEKIHDMIADAITRKTKATQMDEALKTLQELRQEIVIAWNNTNLKGGRTRKTKIIELLEKLEREIENSELEFRDRIAREI
jgi:signal transduction histidine kinase